MIGRRSFLFWLPLIAFGAAPALSPSTARAEERPPLPPVTHPVYRWTTPVRRHGRRRGKSEKSKE